MAAASLSHSLDSTALDQPVERGVQRALLDLQDVVGSEFDGVGNGVAVRRSQPQRAENQQVQRPRQQLVAFALFFGRHTR